MIKRILLIDDDPIQNLINSKMIQKIEVTDDLVVAENGKEAFQKYLTNGQVVPEVIFLDINMPVMDGWEFLDYLNLEKNELQPHIYMLTSSVSPEDIERSESNHLVKGFITKPLSLEKLKFLKETAA